MTNKNAIENHSFFVEYLKSPSKSDLRYAFALPEKGSCKYLYLFCHRLFKHVRQFLQNDVFVVSQRCTQHLQIILKRKAIGRLNICNREFERVVNITHILRNNISV